jgi:hypothetical protein
MVVGHEHADTQCPSNRTTVNLPDSPVGGKRRGRAVCREGSRSFTRRGIGGPPLAAD